MADELQVQIISNDQALLNANVVLSSEALIPDPAGFVQTPERLAFIYASMGLDPMEWLFLDVTVTQLPTPLGSVFIYTVLIRFRRSGTNPPGISGKPLTVTEILPQTFSAQIMSQDVLLYVANIVLATPTRLSDPIGFVTAVMQLKQIYAMLLIDQTQFPLYDTIFARVPVPASNLYVNTFIMRFLLTGQSLPVTT